jgi:hypothetical protein
MPSIWGVARGASRWPRRAISAIDFSVLAKHLPIHTEHAVCLSSEPYFAALDASS